MNYTLKQLQDRVNRLIEQQGEDAHCAAWIYTAEDCRYEDEYPAIEDSELAERIFNDVGNTDYIYQVIQECVDEVTEEQFMLMQQEMVCQTHSLWTLQRLSNVLLINQSTS